MAAEQLHALASRRPSPSNLDRNEYELLGGIRWLRAMLAASYGARPAAPADAAAADRADLDRQGARSK
jgi:hypothetical protein